MNGRVKLDVANALQQVEQLFLLTDPDKAGDVLAQMVLAHYPTLVRVELEKNQCLCYRNHKVKVGVEHCETKYLKSVLERYVL